MSSKIFFSCLDDIRQQYYEQKDERLLPFASVAYQVKTDALSPLLLVSGFIHVHISHCSARSVDFILGGGGSGTNHDRAEFLEVMKKILL